MLVLLHVLHFLNNGAVVSASLVNVALNAVHGSNDIVSSGVLAVNESELVTVAGVLEEAFELSEDLRVDSVSAELDLLVVCEIRRHMFFGVAVVYNLVQESLLYFLEGSGQGSE